jgi:transcriptional regulator with XRE-family HTH domain
MSKGYEPLGSRVRRLRLERGVGQERLALIAHVDQSALSKFERNSKGVGEVALRRLADALGISFDDLVKGTDYRPLGR